MAQELILNDRYDRSLGRLVHTQSHADSGLSDRAASRPTIRERRWSDPDDYRASTDRDLTTLAAICERLLLPGGLHTEAERSREIKRLAAIRDELSQRAWEKMQ